MIKAKQKAKEFASLATISSCFGLKRDAYYKFKDRADKRKQKEQFIIHIVKKRRKSLPREGVRKLKIVGYDLSDSLELNGCVRALNKAIYHAKNIKGLIHHSDRGI